MTRLGLGLLVLLVVGVLAEPAFATGRATGLTPSHHARTYFGGPGIGPYGPPAPKARNPWTAKFLGIRCCKTPEDEYQKFLRQYQIEQARHQAYMQNLNWGAYENYQYAMQTGGYVGGGMGCGAAGCGGHGGACGNCGFTGKCGGGMCGRCGGHFGLKNHFCGHNHGMGCDLSPVPPGEMYPGMNREDAVRYLEGFQYYPPNHLIRSPRDFFMFDVKYGIGRPGQH